MSGHSARRRRQARPATVLACVLAVLALLLPWVGPAAAADLYVGCTWARANQSDWSCTGQTFDWAGQASYETCWRYRPARSSYIEERIDGRWYRQTENAWVSIKRSSRCASGYPWMTRMVVGVYADAVFAARTFRLVMPATGQYTRTTFRFYACAMPAASDGSCWS